MVEVKESAGMLDSIEVVHRDKFGNVLSRKVSGGAVFPDAFCKEGMAAVAALIIASFTAIAIGTGTTAADVENTTLEAEIKRKHATTITRVTTTKTNDTCEWIAQFDKATDGLSGTQTVTEVGVLDNDSAGGNLLQHNVFSPGDACNWDQGDTETITAKFQCKQGS